MRPGVLERLFDEIEATDDRLLQAVLRQASTDELAVVLAIFSLERSRRVLSGLPANRVAEAQAMIEDGEKPTLAATRRLAGRLTGKAPTAAATASPAQRA